jgi:hypothetical protein
MTLVKTLDIFQKTHTTMAVSDDDIERKKVTSFSASSMVNDTVHLQTSYDESPSNLLRSAFCFVDTIKVRASVFRLLGGAAPEIIAHLMFPQLPPRKINLSCMNTSITWVESSLYLRDDR